MKKKQSYLVIFLLLFIFSFSKNGSSQNFKFKHLSSDEGLSQVSVQAILQDSDGFMWFATQDGLNRYDGFHFKIFKNNPQDKNSISSNVVYCLFEDTDGLIYIGTQETGLSVYNRYTETFVNYKPSNNKGSISSPAVRSICSSNNRNELLIGTENGLCVFNKITKLFETIKPDNTDKPYYIMKVFKTEAGKLLVAAPRFGIYEYKPTVKKLIPFYVPENFNNPNIDAYSMALINIEEKNKLLWISSFKGGVYQLDANTGKLIKHISFNLVDENLNAIKDIKSAPNTPYIYVATFGGLIQYNCLTSDYIIVKHHINDNKSLINNNVLVLYIDKKSTLWLGTYSNGVEMSLMASEKFKHIKIDDKQESNSVNCFLETKEKSIYVATDNGLYIFDKNNNKVSSQKINNLKPYSLYQTSRNTIWIGTLNNGLYKYNTYTNELNVIPNFKETSVYEIKEGPNKSIIVATYNDGLYLIDSLNMGIKKYDSHEIILNNITTFFFDKQTNKLLVASKEGISLINFESNRRSNLVKNYTYKQNENSISSNLIYDIIKDKKGIFWIATSNGLNKFDTKTNLFKNYAETDGLSNNNVWSISPDLEGYLWLATNNGLSRFNPNIENINGSAFKNYDVSDGLQGKEFNQGASLVCADGSILVGGLNGFNYFNPKDIRDNKIVPKTYIYSFSRQGKEVKLDTAIVFKNNIVLPYSENYFSIEIISQNYTSPEKTKFIYMLEGKDAQWSAPSSTRFISYTGLEGGTYKLKIKACNNDGIWNDTPTQLTITIIPPWYKTTWFYLLGSIGIIGSIIGFVQYRTSAIKKVNKALENKVAERTKELAEKNHDITSSIEYAKRIQDAILPARELIYSRLKDCFILYKPKDIVSGDFYWFFEKDQYQMIAAVDCTGHGVPGAFMSMIGHNLLNQIVSDKNITEPSQILQELHKGVQNALKQGQSKINTNDGMDVSFLVINTSTNTFSWSGAFRNLIMINSNSELEKIEGNKYPIGGSQLDNERVFKTHTHTCEPNTMLYLFSDGYADQFGGDKGKKFMVKRFHQLLMDVSKHDVKTQKNEIEKTFNNWKGSHEQVDDVLVIGIKL